MYVTFDSERIVAICSLTFNSVGIEANFSIVKTYEEGWLKISEIEIMNKQLIVSHNGGVSLIYSLTLCRKYFLHSFYQNKWLLIKTAFFLLQNIA